MRILHIVHQFLPDQVGGTEHYTLALARCQVQAGHEVAVFHRRSGRDRRLDRDTVDGLALYRATNGPLTPLGRFRSTLGDRFLADGLRQAVAETRPELVHVQHLMGLPAGALLQLDPVLPLVGTLHDYWWICANAQLVTDYGGRLCDGPRLWLNCARCGLARAGLDRLWPLAPLAAPLFARRAALLRRVRARVAAWIAPTEFVAGWHAARGFERLHVVGHGIEPPPPELISEAGQRDSQGLHVVYVGGLAQQKGVHVLIDAFNGLGSGARLTIAGDETAFPGYSARLHQLAGHPGIRFVGRLNRTEVWQTLAAADVLVVPSLWYETASLVIQEAFALGIPVIAADHGALSERVRHGVDGLRLPPGDVAALRQALRRLGDEPGLLARLRAGIRPVVSLAEHAAAVEAVYRQVRA